MTLAGVIAPQDRPEGTVSLRVVVPLKPFRAPMVMVEFAEMPALTGAGEEALTVKSVKVKMAVAVRDEFPGEPLPPIVTVKVPATVEEQDKADAAVPFLASVTGETLKTRQERPGSIVFVSAMDPAKFWELVKVIVELRREPATPVGDVVDMEKSPTCEKKMTEWV